MARKATSAAPAVSASNDLRAASKQAKEASTPRRAAIAWDRSTVTPVGPSLVPWARTGLPRLIDARSTPVGARSATTAGSVTHAPSATGATQTKDLEPVRAHQQIALIAGYSGGWWSPLFAWGTQRASRERTARSTVPTASSGAMLRGGGGLTSTDRSAIIRKDASRRVAGPMRR